MSLTMNTNKIKIMNTSGVTIFTTDSRLMQIHSTASFSYTVPIVASTTSYTPYDVTYTISNAFTYSATFIIGYVVFGTFKYAVNGAIVLGFGFYGIAPAWQDSVGFYVNGKDFVIHRRGFRGMGQSVPSQTLQFLVYAGNYDL